jgi:hypothetical protein
MSEPTVVLGRSERTGTRRRSRSGWRSDGGRTVPPPFTDVLCGVDDSRGSAEAVRQATMLCAPATKLSFLAISHTTEVSLSAQTELSEAGARTALDEAARRAREAGLQASTESCATGPA